MLNEKDEKSQSQTNLNSEDRVISENTLQESLQSQSQNILRRSTRKRIMPDRYQ